MASLANKQTSGNIICNACDTILARPEQVVFYDSHLICPYNRIDGIIKRAALKKIPHPKVNKRNMFPEKLLCKCGQDIANLGKIGPEIFNIFFDASNCKIAGLRQFNSWKDVKGICAIQSTRKNTFNSRKTKRDKHINKSLSGNRKDQYQNSNRNAESKHNGLRGNVRSSRSGFSGQSKFTPNLQRGGRKSFVNRLKDGEAMLKTPSDARQLFHQFSKDFVTPEELALMFDDRLAEVLKDAIRLLYPNISLVLKMLEKLGVDHLNYGVYKAKVRICLSAVYEVPEFLDAVREKWKNNLALDPAVIAWFLLKIADDNKVRSDPNVLQVVEELLEHREARGMRQLGNELITVFKPSAEIAGSEEIKNNQKLSISLDAAKEAMRRPGVRDHDNDKENFRDIAIIPTASELLDKEGPYLPPVEGSEYVVNAEAKLLDRQFRLLREDLVGTVRDNLQEELKNQESARFRLFSSPSVIDFDLKPEPHIVVSVSMSMHLAGRVKRLKPKEAHDFFENGPGRRVFGQHSLVVLVNKQSSQTEKSGYEASVIAVGLVVARRDIYSPQKSSKFTTKLRVGVKFEGSSLSTVFSSMHSGGKVPLATHMLSSSVGFFNYEPVLKSLQELQSIPLGKSLVHLNAAEKPCLPHGGKVVADFSLAIQKSVASDPSQSAALQLIFDSKVVLVQGPPGTGKTYIGVKMVQAMLEAQNTGSSLHKPLRILCLCYTNHALDSFLESLLEAEIPAELFVRIGNSKKVDPRLLSRCLGELDQEKFTHVENRGYAGLKQVEERLNAEINHIRSKLEGNKWWTGSLNSWREAKSILEYNDQYQAILDLDTTQYLDKVETSGFKTIGKRGKKITDNYLWQRWCHGEDSGIFQNLLESTDESVWKLNKKQRLNLRANWRQTWVELQHQKLSTLMASLATNVKNLRSLRNGAVVRTLKKATIIGCTIIAAAKRRDILSEVAPSVVLLEEAGEILESQVISNLSPLTEQLIMIGDHKQLPPKIEQYRLQKDSGSQYNLNISLFERLALSEKLSMATLHVQHRMRPNISCLIRETMYPELIDHKSTLQRPDVSGVSKNIVWINHVEPEAADQDATALGSNSKLNFHEAKMVVGITVHLLRQKGYTSNKLTILTPYLGQLQLIKRELAKQKLSTVIGALDQGDLRRFNLDDGNAEQKHTLKAVRAATIDNFQGEEADIIIISLVRSNSAGRIGFLSSPERVNVLLSRARIGMYIVGNFDTFERCTSQRGRNLWGKIKSILTEQHRILDYFPCICENHKRSIEVASLDDFERLAPHGGCDAMCEIKLPCGHKCPLKCHPEDHLISPIYCDVQTNDLCSYGHFGKRDCSAKTVTCNKWIEWKCWQNHILHGICKNKRPMTCTTCDDIARKEKQLEEQQKTKLKKILDMEKKKVNLQAEIEAEELKNSHSERERLLQEELKSMAKHLESLKLNINKAKSYTDFIQTDAKQHDQRQAEADVPNAKISKTVQQSHDKVLRADETSEVDITMSEENPLSISPEVRASALSRQPTSKMQESPKSPDLNDVPSETKDIVKGLKDEESSNKQNLEEDIKYLLKEYEERGALPAHNLLDSIQLQYQPNCIPNSLNALKYIFENNLDSSNTSSWSPIMNKNNSQIRNLEEAVISWANVIKTRDEFPFISKNFALNLKQFNRLHPSQLPQSCIDQMASWLKPKLAEDKANASSGVATSASIKIDKGSSIDFVENKSDKNIKEKWGKILARDNKAPKVVSKVLKMIGLEKIKSSLIMMYHRIRLAQEQNDTGSSSYNVRFEGNPGTGKTTIAKHYCKFLKELEILPKTSTPTITSGAALINGGVKKLEKTLDDIKKAKGGVIFVDEAYQLVSDRAGKQVLDFILPLAEGLQTDYGSLVWVFAGYKKDMENLFEHNAGLPSRFPLRFHFDDYTNYELLKIFHSMLENQLKQSKDTHSANVPVNQSSQSYEMKTEARKNVFRCNARDSRIAMRRLGRQRGKMGFGNARAVRIFFDRVRNRQSQRIAKEVDQGLNPDKYVFTQEDMLGPAVSEQSLKASSSYKLLMAMEGLIPVKESINSIVRLVCQNLKLELQEKPLRNIVLNRIFLGNPGTGKTTVARIYAKLLTEAGMLSKGDVILKSPSDFVGDVLGSSEKNTRNALQAAQGCVLVIDEAYSLYSGSNIGKNNDPYKTAVVDTLVEQISAKPGDDCCVVMLGYQEEMEKMFKNVNPGLSRRFQSDRPFHFPDYNDESLLKIMMSKSKKSQLKIGLGLAKRAIASLSRARAKPHFGNAGAVDNLLSDAKLRLAERDGGDELTADDFGFDEKEGPDDFLLDTLFDDLVGCESVKNELLQLRNIVQFAKIRGDPVETLVSYNYLFLGNPGTGKTTVAHRMGKMFQALGLLPDDKVEFVQASDLCTGYAGQAGQKTHDVLQRSRGGVLFIDEAYQLDPKRGGPYMTEVVDKLVGALTSEEFQNKLLVVLAGYDADMDQMLKTNPGLKSRFTGRLHFNDMKPSTVVELLVKTFQKDKFDLNIKSSSTTVLQLAQRLCKSNDFSNGRDVVTWVKFCKAEVANRCAKSGSKRTSRRSLNPVHLSDLQKALNKLLEGRIVKEDSKSCVQFSPLLGEQAQATQEDHMPPTDVATATEAAISAEENICDFGEETDEEEYVVIQKAEQEEDTALNCFEGADGRMLQSLQNIVDELGINSEEGIRKFAELDASGPQLNDLAVKLAQKLNASLETAKKQLIEWQQAQKQLQKQKTKWCKRGMQPIWRCAVCGRANRPYIVCYVAPYIVRYQPINLST